MQSENHSKIMHGQNDKCYLKKKKHVLSHMLQELVTFAFDSVVAQIINSWQARRFHRLPPSFLSLHLCFLPLCCSHPTPAPAVRLCLPNESVWLAVCCCQGAGEGDYSRRTGPGPGRPELTTGKKGFWKIPPKQQLPPSIFHFFLFFCTMLVIDWRERWGRGEKKVPDQSLA